MQDELVADGLLLGVARAEPYAETERLIAERRARGLFGDLRFTLTNTPRSCHPERLVRGARSVIAAAHAALAARRAARPRGRPAACRATPGAIPTRRCASASRRVADRLRARGARCAVFVDSNHHVDRDAAVRAGLAFSARNTMAIVPGEGSFVALGAIVTDAELEPAEELVPPGCGSCTLCLDACPTGRADRAGRARRDALPVDDDAGARAGARTSTPPRSRIASTAATSARTCAPGTRARPRRRAELPEDPGAWVSLADWLELPGDELLARHAHLYVPERDPRYLRRNALVALGNAPAEQRELAAALRRRPRSAAARRRAARAHALTQRRRCPRARRGRARRCRRRRRARRRPGWRPRPGPRGRGGAPSASQRADRAVERAPAAEVRAAVAVELRDVVAEQQRGAVRGLGARSRWSSRSAARARRARRAAGRRARRSAPIGMPVITIAAPSAASLALAGGAQRDGGRVLARPGPQRLQVGGAVIPDDDVADARARRAPAGACAPRRPRR